MPVVLKRRVMAKGLAELDTASLSGKLPKPTIGHVWCVIAVNNKTGHGKVLTRKAMTLDEAEASLPRFSENANRRVQLYPLIKEVK